jgi:hypothetical protein
VDKVECEKEVNILNIMEEDWDCIVILDACRYDYFYHVYKDYFVGNLEKRISLGSSTPEWREKSFPDYYSDVVYISGNPYINSRLAIEGFNAKDHFYRICDVWDFGWNAELSTVPPKEINKSALRHLKEFPRKRFIIHYMQPHEPYLSGRFTNKAISINHVYKNGLQWQQYYWEQTSKPIEKALRLIAARIKMKNIWRLREMLYLPPAQPMDAVRRKYGVKGLRQAYYENLRIVLDYVSRLCSYILDFGSNKKIIITSDHGELLGEEGYYCHKRKSKQPILREIPLLKVTEVKKRTQIKRAAQSTDKKLNEIKSEILIKKRLRKLGYL